VIGALGALAAGAAFSALDPGLSGPAAGRLVRRLRAAAWLVGRDEQPRPELASEVRIDIPGWPADDVAEMGRLVQGDPPAPLHPEQLAYILFTSGSTGEPKGVMISRRGLAVLTAAVADRLGLRPQDRWLQLAALGFDVVVEEIFPILAAGGTIACRPTAGVPDPQELHQLLAAHQATVAELTTQHWREYLRWLEVTGAVPPAGLRWLIVGGEAMDPDHYRRWQQLFPTPLVHVYGVTECSCSSTMYTGLLGPDAGHVPVGIPLAGSLVLLSAQDAVTGRPEESGVGEVLLGGPGVARGYLADPVQTALRFRPDPDARVPGARRYLTGDWGRLLDDGSLVFLSRHDAQVKIRGHRLELAQVDRALRALPGIDDAAACLDPRTGGIVAFLRPAGQAPPAGQAELLSAREAAELSSALASDLPSWAVPARFARIGMLPVTVNGKLDRASLAGQLSGLTAVSAQPEDGSDQDSGAGETGSDQTGAILAVLREVLGDAGLTADDDFFSHGGNSILAMQAATMLRERTSLDGLRARDLFDYRTAVRLGERSAGDS